MFINKTRTRNFFTIIIRIKKTVTLYFGQKNKIIKMNRFPTTVLIQFVLEDITIKSLKFIFIIYFHVSIQRYNV